MEITTTELTPEQQARQDDDNAVKDAAYNVTLAAHNVTYAVARLKGIAQYAGHDAYIAAYEVDSVDIDTLRNALATLAHQLRHDPPNLADRIDDLIAALNTLETTINHKGA